MLAVIFDMDGLMFDTETLNHRSWIETGKKYGWPITTELLSQTIGMSLARTRELLLKKFGANFDFDAMREARIECTARWIEKNGVPVKPGLLELLTWLDQNGFKRAMATSTEGRLVDFYRANIKDPKLDQKLQCFHAVITGEQVKNGKPAPDIFLEAARQLDAEPRDCVVLEDSYNGIKAAHAAGMVPIMVPDLLPPTPEILELVHAQVQSLHNVIPELRKLARIER